MDHPDPILTWTVHTSGLTAGRARTATSPATPAQRCLDLWQEFLAAATSHPLHITVTTADRSDIAPTVSVHVDTDRGTLHVAVPHSVLQGPPGRLAAEILDVVVPALVAIAEHRPHPQPPRFWQSPHTEPPPHDPQPGAQLEDLTQGEVLLLGRLDGTPDDADTRFCKLDAYLCERIEEPGIAARAGTDATASTVYWVLELLDGH